MGRQNPDDSENAFGFVARGCDNPWRPAVGRFGEVRRPAPNEVDLRRTRVCSLKTQDEFLDVDSSARQTLAAGSGFDDRSVVES